jgi:hypothetical protein
MGRNPNELDQDALLIPRRGHSRVLALPRRRGLRYTLIAIFCLVLDILTAIQLAVRSPTGPFHVVSTIGLIAISVPLCILSVLLRRPALKSVAAVIGGFLAILAAKSLDPFEPTRLQRSTGLKSQTWGERATRWPGGSGSGRGLLRHFTMTTTRLSVELNTSLDTCSGSTSTLGSAASHTHDNRSVIASG